MPLDSTTPSKPPRRGRPALRWLDLDEVALELGNPELDAAALQRLLEVLPGALPGAERHDERGWLVPSTTLRALRVPRKGVELPQMATIAEVCVAMRRSPSVVHRWCTEPLEDGEPQVKALRVAGGWLIDVASLLDPATWSRKARASSFLLKRSNSREVQAP